MKLTIILVIMSSLIFNGCTKIQPNKIKLRQIHPPDIPKYKIVIRHNCICGKNKTLVLKLIKEFRANEIMYKKILKEIYKLGDK